MPGPIAPGFGIARIEQDQVFSRFRIWVIAIGGMKITDLAGRIFQWGAAEGPAQIERLFGGITQRKPRGMKEGHWEVACQIDALIVESDIYRKCFHQVFAIVAIVESPSAEKQGQGRVHRCVRRIIPANAKPSAAKFDRLLPWRGKLERANHGGFCTQLEQVCASPRRKRNYS